MFSVCRVGFRTSFLSRLFADEAEVEMWCGCVCWLKGWGSNKSCRSFPAIVLIVKQNCLLFGHLVHTSPFCSFVFLVSFQMLQCSSLCHLCNSFYIWVHELHGLIISIFSMSQVQNIVPVDLKAKVFTAVSTDTLLMWNFIPDSK